MISSCQLNQGDNQYFTMEYLKKITLFTSLPERVKYLMVEAEHDCFFVVGHENGPIERIGVVKLLLMGDSKAFRAMLKDSALAEQGDIRIKDVDPETFMYYLTCAYGGEEFVLKKLTFAELVKLFCMADKYLADEISSNICSHMKERFSLSFENFFLALSHPRCYQDTDLECEILKVLKYDFKKITMDDQFLGLSETAIEFILQQDCYTTQVKEIDLWNATLRWAEYKSGSTDPEDLRSYIFDLLEYFRFLSMDYTEFWEKVVPSGVLLEEEINDICKAFGTGEPCSIEYLSKSKHSRIEVGSDCDKITSSFVENPLCAFIHCIVKETSTLVPNRDYCSKKYQYSEHLWYIKAARRKTNNATKSYKKKYALGVYVTCEGQTKKWSCTVNVEINLINLAGKSSQSNRYTRTLVII